MANEEIKNKLKSILTGWHFYRIKTINLAIEEITKMMKKEFINGLSLGFFLSSLFVLIYVLCT